MENCNRCKWEEFKRCNLPGHESDRETHDEYNRCSGWERYTMDREIIGGWKSRNGADDKLRELGYTLGYGIIEGLYRTITLKGEHKHFFDYDPGSARYAGVLTLLK